MHQQHLLAAEHIEMAIIRANVHVANVQILLLMIAYETA